MEQNIADLLKDAFSEVDTEDFGHLQFDEGTNPSQTQPSTDVEFDMKDASQLWVTSEQGSFEMFTKVHKAEDSDPDPDSDSITNDSVPFEFGISKATILGEENNENDVSQVGTIKLSHESSEDQGIQSKEHQELPSPLFVEKQTPEERSSGSEDEEGEEEDGEEDDVGEEEKEEDEGELEEVEGKLEEKEKEVDEEEVEEEEEEDGEEEDEEEEEKLGNYDTGEPTEQTPHYNVNKLGSSTCLDQDDNFVEGQVAEKATSKSSVAQQENPVFAESTIGTFVMEFGVGDSSILGEENKENDLNWEGTIRCFQESVGNQGFQSKTHQGIVSPIAFDENQSQEDRSSGSENEKEEEDVEEEEAEADVEEDEEMLSNYNTEEPTKQTPHCDPVGNTDKTLMSTEPNTTPVGYSGGDDLKEFTEEDQEGVKESLADFPSDLFPSEGEGEEHTKHDKNQPSLLVDSSLGDGYSTNKKTSIEYNFHEDHIGSTDLADFSDFNFSPDNEPEIKIKELEYQTISKQIKEDIGVSFQKENLHEDDLQDSQTNDSSTKEDASNPSNVQQDYSEDSDISSDHSTSHKDKTIQDDSFLFASVKNEETDPEERGGIFSETHRDIPNASLIISTQELRSTLESVQLDQLVEPSLIKAEDRSHSELLNCAGDKLFIPEGFLSSDVFMSQNNLPIDEYDWDFTIEEPAEFIFDEAEAQKNTEHMEEYDSDEDLEGGQQNERDWEQEKTRIEAFYRFYDDQVEAEDETERNHKVTFCLDHESSEYDAQADTEDKSAEEHCSDLEDMPVDFPALNVEEISASITYSQDQESSDYEEDSESSEQEVDNVPGTPVNAVKPEFQSESEDEPQEKLFHPEKPKIQPKKQLHSDPAQKACTGKSKCFTVLKSVLALGLMTVIGVVSFWWATDNLDWIH